MDCFAVHFEDDPAREEVRERHVTAHRRYLEQLGDRVLAAGTLHSGTGAPVGGIWLLRAGSELQAREIIEADPYFEHGLRRTIRIWQWRPSISA